MDKKIIDILQKSVLCRDMSEEQVMEVLKNSVTQIETYEKNQVIFHEGEKPEKLYLLVEGKVTICKDTISGKRIMITQITNEGDMFGEVYLFMKKKGYDMYAFVTEKSIILEISYQIFSISGNGISKTNYKMMQNLLELFAQKAYIMSNKIKVLGSGSIRQKIVRYLLEIKKQNENSSIVLSREEMADWLNVARPSLSRELGKMQEEGFIKIQGRNILILDEEGLEEYL